MALRDPWRNLARALAFACGIPLALALAQLVLAHRALDDADALALDALATAVSFALLAASLASLGGAPLGSRLGLARGRLGTRQVAAATVGLVALSHAVHAAIELAGASSPALARFEDALGDLGVAHIVVPLAVLAPASAAGEELFFRGFLQRGLGRAVGPGAAIALASAAFGAAHGDWVHGTAAAVLGLYLGTLVWIADSIRPAIAAHACNNAIALLEVAADVHLPVGPVVTPVSGLLGVTLACVMLWRIRRDAAAAASLQSPAGSAE